jgi:hypothetical protein
MKKKIFKQRMYFLVMYNISGIQQGIQSIHANNAFIKKYGLTPEFLQWINNDETVIILNGGTSRTSKRVSEIGTMQKYEKELMKNNIKYAVFHEPDLNNALSAIAFLVDERVWDKKNYPDYDERSILDKKMSIKQYFKKIGNKENDFLKNFLKNFKLA